MRVWELVVLWRLGENRKDRNCKQNGNTFIQTCKQTNKQKKVGAHEGTIEGTMDKERRDCDGL